MKNKEPMVAGGDKPIDSPTMEEHNGSLTKEDCYEIQLEGYLDKHWAEWLGGLEITHQADGNTLLTGLIPDQAALHGILVRLRDLGLPLVWLKRIDNG